jgi:hypothetical protein
MEIERLTTYFIMRNVNTMWKKGHKQELTKEDLAFVIPSKVNTYDQIILLYLYFYKTKGDIIPYSNEQIEENKGKDSQSFFDEEYQKVIDNDPSIVERLDPRVKEYMKEKGN